MLKVTTLHGGMKLRSISLSKAIEIILILTILMGIVGSSFANVLDKKVIHNTGKISPYIVAASGYWRDIQNAVDHAAAMGGGNIYIPEGVWNFVNPGESWTGARVVIPAGVNVFGAPTEKYSNGSVIEWKTVLVMPWDMPGSRSGDPPHWFLIQGDSDPQKPTRFSDIKLVGYKHFDPNATGFYKAIKVLRVANFRIDHCAFIEIPEGVTAWEYCSGVIDHNFFHNEHAYYTVDWSNRVVGYAVSVSQDKPTMWVPLESILGKYTNYTVFIENNVFTKWRDVVVGNYGAHYVFRHNIVRNGLGHGEVDLHPSWTSPYVSCRAAEVYDNIFENPVYSGDCVIEIWAGGGVFFNNTVIGYAKFMRGSGTSWDPDLMGPKEVYIWNNDLGGAILEDTPMEEGVDYFLYKPDWYTPYPYPHPLTRG